MQNASNSNMDLGISSKYMRPPAEAYAKPSPCPGNIARDRLLPLNNTNTTVSTADPSLTSTSAQMYTDDMSMMQPQVIGMGMLAPDQIQLQLQQQQLQQGGQQQTPWLMDDNALLDLDMSALDGDVSWEGWDDLVRDFQMEVDNQPPDVARGPTLGGMGSWW